MNELKTNILQSIVGYRRMSMEPLPPEIPSKLSSSQIKLRQLIKKTPMNSTNGNSPNQTFQYLSKQTMEGTQWETCSPTMSRVSDCSQAVLVKPKNNLSPKPNSKAHSKLSKNSLFGLPINVDFSKAKGQSNNEKIKQPSQLANISFASSPKNIGMEFNEIGVNYLRTATDDGFNPQNYMNFILFQSKTSQNQEKKIIKLQSYLDDAEDDDKNLSLEIKKDSYTTPNSRFKKNSTNKNMSQENQATSQFLKQDILDFNCSMVENENLIFKRNKSKTSQHPHHEEIRREEQNRKLDGEKYGILEILNNKNITNDGVKKKYINTEDLLPKEDEKNRRNTIKEIFGKKRLAITPDSLTNRENDPNLAFENKVRKLTPKLVPTSINGSKNGRIDSRKRPSTSTKGTRVKTNSKNILKKESPCKNVATRIGNGRRENIPGYLMLRAIKGSSPNILSNTLSHTCCSTKNQKKGGDSQTFMQGITGEFDKNGPSSTEITLSRTHDTTTNLKGLNRKEFTLEEDDRKTVKSKRLLRTKSHGGSGQIEEAIAEIARNDAMNKSGLRRKSRILSLKQNLKERSSTFKSVDDKDSHSNILQNLETRKEISDKILSLSTYGDILTTKNYDHNPNVEKATVLYQVLERTNKILTAYKEKEREWHSEKQNLIKQIKRLQEKENLS